MSKVVETYNDLKYLAICNPSPEYIQARKDEGWTVTRITKDMGAWTMPVKEYEKLLKQKRGEI